MSKKPAGILAALKDRAAAMPRRNQTWFDRLDKSDQAELNDAKLAYLRGDLGRLSMSRFATMLSAELAERKIAQVGRQGVEAWLRRN